MSTLNRATSAARRVARTLEIRSTRWERAAHRRFFSKGNRVECPICGWSGLSFAASR